MMFMQYFVAGAIVPVMSLYLKDHLDFSGSQVGIILAMSAIAAFVSPVIGAFIADRVISAERLLGLCHFCGAAVMAVLSFQTDFLPVLLLYLVYVLILGPSVALTNSITFHHTPKADHHFGGIRMWGTIGWIAVAWLFSYLWLRGGGQDNIASRLPDALKFSAISSVFFGAYALTLPKSDARSENTASIVPIESFRVLVRPEILLLSVICFLMALIHKYYYFGMAPFLRLTGFSDSNIMPVMSLGQITEVFAMAFLGFCLVRGGFKRVMIAGICAELIRFTIYAIGEPIPLIVCGTFLHGFSFTFFATTAYIYLDSHCDKSSRTGVHQLFAIITGGFGNFFGNLVAGWAADYFTDFQSGSIDYVYFWTVPALIAAVCLVTIVLFFPSRNTLRSGE